jgi:hypothetical protein
MSLHTLQAKAKGAAGKNAGDNERTANEQG